MLLILLLGPQTHLSLQLETNMRTKEQAEKAKKQGYKDGFFRKTPVNTGSGGRK